MKLPRTQKGFAPVELILILFFLSAVGFVGWFVASHRNNSAKYTTPEQITTNPTSTSGNPSITDGQLKEIKASTILTNVTTKTFSFEGATVSFALPEKWTLSTHAVDEGDTDEDVDLVQDPSSKLILGISIVRNTVQPFQQDQPSFKADRFFRGVNGQTYYLSAIKGSVKTESEYQLLDISKCSDRSCDTEINSEFDLVLYIRPGFEAESVSLDNPIVNDLIAITQSIKIL